MWTIIYERWISIFGIPKIILSDNASYFNGTYLLDKFTSMQIRKATTTPYYPPGNSVVENFNRSLKSYLSLMEKQYELQFEETLMCIALTHNTTPQLHTAETPSALLFGLDINTPDNGLRSYSIDRYNLDTHWRLTQQIRDDANDRLIYKYKDILLKPQVPVIFPGDLVFKKLNAPEIRSQQGLIGSKKLLRNYSEPYRVIKHSDSSKQQIIIMSLFPGKSKHIANINQLVKLPR